VDELLDIGEVAERSGLAPSALRHYERLGLITPAARAGLRRQYEPAVMDRLALIVAGSQAGFRLDEVGQVFGAGMPDQELRDRLRLKAAEIDRRIEMLAEVRDRLLHATECTGPSLLECPRFVEGVRQVLPVSRVGSRPPAPAP
jgi:DNA-binding transcriptional MerR regulator